MGLLNNKFEVFQLFPTPVYRTTLNRKFLKNEKQILFNKNNFLKKMLEIKQVITHIY